MKMFGKNSLSSVLFWIFILCFAGTTVLFLWQLGIYFIDREIIDNNNPFHLLMYVIPVFPKIVTFFLLIMIFRSFKSDTIFTNQTLNYLNIFAAFSLCMPILNAIFNYILLDNEISLVINIMFPNLMLGIFAAFIATIFKKGLHLQDENNLTI